MTSRQTPLLIVDASVDVTGALISAASQASLLADSVPAAILVLPKGHRIPVERTRAFSKVITIPIVPLRKSVTSILLYGPTLLVGSILLRFHIHKWRCHTVQFNDFYLPHGLLLRMLGYKGDILTFVRIDCRRYGLAGRLWLAAARRSSTEIEPFAISTANSGSQASGVALSANHRAFAAASAASPSACRRY